MSQAVPFAGTEIVLLELAKKFLTAIVPSQPVQAPTLLRVTVATEELLFLS